MYDYYELFRNFEEFASEYPELAEQLLEDDVLNVTLIAVPLAIVGARFLYVITNLDSYDSFLR